MVDSSQAIENSYSYEAFGQPTVGQSDVANPYLFVGGYGVRWESTPSLYYMQARYYSPGVGRFISEDPYGGAPQDPLSLHRYLYCGNGPARYVDPQGLYWRDDTTIGQLTHWSTWVEGVQWGWDSGYYSCLASCTLLGYTPLQCSGLGAQLTHLIGQLPYVYIAAGGYLTRLWNKEPILRSLLVGHFKVTRPEIAGWFTRGESSTLVAKAMPTARALAGLQGTVLLLGLSSHFCMWQCGPRLRRGGG